jgi:hypothetical protein
MDDALNFVESDSLVSSKKFSHGLAQHIFCMCSQFAISQIIGPCLMKLALLPWMGRKISFSASTK